MFDRRRFLQALAALGVTGATPAYTQERLRFAAPPFALGVASGYPDPSGFSLWTRLVVDPTQPGGGVDPVRTRLNWEVATDDRMKNVVASGFEFLVPASAHSLHVDVRGLEADRWYWYRFAAGNSESPIGRTRTAPAVRAPASRLRFAFASCQHFGQGAFSAYRHMLADELDLVAFLGDYICAKDAAGDAARTHASSRPQTLSRYRARHALYKSDPDLRAAHAAYPWICTWDDHGAANEYAANPPETKVSLEERLARRLVAYKAYYEHMPLRNGMRPTADGMQIFAQMGWGDLARFYILDGRQYRSERTLLGKRQEAWLQTALEFTPARWNVLTQQARMARLEQPPGPRCQAWTDGWDGHPAARRKLLEFMAAKQIRNPVAIAGDTHAFYVADLTPDVQDAASQVVASEFVASSIAAKPSSPRERAEQSLPENPHVKFADNRHCGYVRVELTPRQWHADLRAIESVEKPDAPCSTLARFVVDDGQPGPRRA
ncbi:MAG: alkaline phosphatase [Betaproteobacteria bacterium]|nr:MAG: alkaline phosphatase [Betaproteobacteria bacterium]